MSEQAGENAFDIEVHCPSCGFVLDDYEQEGEIACAVCSRRFALAGHLCPACATYHEEEQAACAECGTALVRLCRNCQAANWTGNLVCIQCGKNIDLLSHLESKSSQSTADRLRDQMVSARAVNEMESAASDRRMAELMAIEAARQAELRRQREKQQRQERNMLIIVLIAVMLFLLAMIVTALSGFFN